MSKKIIIAILLVLLLVIAGSISYVLLSSSFADRGQPQATPSPTYVVKRSEEVPISTHRAYSMDANQMPTAVTPWGIALDYAHGFVWVAEPGCALNPTCPSSVQGALGQFALSDGNFIATFQEPEGYSSPLFAVVDGEGDVWFTQPDSNAIGEFDPLHGSWQEWQLKQGSIPFDLVLDAQGNLWFTEFGSDDIGFFNPHTQTIVENRIPTPASNPYGITIDRHGTAWFTENAPGIDQIGSFTTTTSGTVTINEHAAGTIRPHLITTDQAGNVWYTGGFGGDIGEFNPGSGNSTSLFVSQGLCSSPSSCTGTHISGIAVDSKGNIWFTDSLSQRVGYVVPASGQIVTETLNNSNAHPYDGLIIDSSDRVWFTEEFGLTLVMLPASTVR